MVRMARCALEARPMPSAAYRTAYPIVALTVVAAFTGCSGSASAPSTPGAGGLPAIAGRQGWLSPAAKIKPLIYVSDNSANAIVIYSQNQSNPAPIGMITDGIAGPLGNFVDAKGTLYVANSSNNTVTEYPAGATSPSVTLSSGINHPISVAADANGDVAVGEFSQNEILEFPAGGSAPTVTITLLTLPEALTFDKRGRLYAAWNVSGSQLIGHVSRCERMQAVCVDRGIIEGESGGLALDTERNLILGDQTNAVINIYGPKQTSPARTISTTGHSPYKFELNQREHKLYVADIKTGTVIVYNYQTGAQIGTISQGLTSAWGVSLSPPAPYAK
jgi:DNA-binding beta-propeller fold protein YncE